MHEENQNEKPKRRGKVFYLQLAVYVVLGLFCLLMLSWFVMGAWSRSNPPLDLGLAESGQLRDCPASPNCVCSQITDQQRSLAEKHGHEIAPIRPQPGQTLDALWQQLIDHLKKEKGVTLTKEEANYLHATYRVAIFGFIDDLELLKSPLENVIHVRSASRVGYSDLGVNRKRVENMYRVLGLKA